MYYYIMVLLWVSLIVLWAFTLLLLGNSIVEYTTTRNPKFSVKKSPLLYYIVKFGRMFFCSCNKHEAQRTERPTILDPDQGQWFIVYPGMSMRPVGLSYRTARLLCRQRDMDYSFILYNEPPPIWGTKRQSAQYARLQTAFSLL